MSNQKKRNSLIELLRFIFAMDVVKNHGYFPYQGPGFGPGRIAVEFFFVLSGYLLIRGIEKFEDKPFMKGYGAMILSRIKSLGVPLFVALFFNILYKTVVGIDGILDISIWGFLWYVHTLIQVSSLYYVLHRCIKNKKTFIIVTACIFVVSATIHSLPFCFTWGIFRGLSAISAGILLSYIPKIHIKHQNLLYIPLTIVFVMTMCMYFHEIVLAEETLLDYFLYPCLIYLSFNIDCHNIVFDYLGSLSWGLYAYQCVVRYIEAIAGENATISFIIIVALTLITDIVKRIIKRRKEVQYLNA